MCAGAIYAGMDMIVSSGNVTISESEASEDGGSRFLGIRTGDEGSAQVARRRVLRVQGLRGLQADAAPALNAASHIVKTNNVYLGFLLVPLSARTDLATAVYLINAKNGRKQALAEMLVL